MPSDFAALMKIFLLVRPQSVLRWSTAIFLRPSAAAYLAQPRLLVGLAERVAPHIVAALGEVRVRVGEAELHEAGALVDRRRRHRGRAREIADLDHDLRIADELLGDRDRLARVGLAVLELVGERAALDAAGAVDLVQREIEALLPLRAVLGVGPGQRAADADHDRVAGGLRRGERRPHDQGEGRNADRGDAAAHLGGTVRQGSISRLVMACGCLVC